MPTARAAGSPRSRALDCGMTGSPSLVGSTNTNAAACSRWPLTGSKGAPSTVVLPWIATEATTLPPGSEAVISEVKTKPGVAGRAAGRPNVDRSSSLLGPPRCAHMPIVRPIRPARAYRRLVIPLEGLTGNGFMRRLGCLPSMATIRRSWSLALRWATSPCAPTLGSTRGRGRPRPCE